MKTTYTKTRDGAKAIIRYIQHRPGKDGTKITRTLFGNDGVMSRQQAYRMIDAAAKGTWFYRIIISPDPSVEDTRRDLHLRTITEQTIANLAEQLQGDILYVAAEHADHAPHRHVHALALLPRKLAKPDLQFLRETATVAALLQRHERDAVLEYQAREREEEALEWER